MAEAERWMIRWGDLPGAPDPKTGFNLLAKGNIDVFMDMYPQMLAYKEKGIAEIRQMRVAGQIDQRQLDAWEDIEEGRVNNNQRFVWNGNERLLKFEQEVTLQNGAYAANLPYWRSITNHANPFVPSMPSPIPGDDSTFQSFNGRLVGPFQIPDYGSLGNFDERWAWITQKQLPAYKVWSNENQSIDVQRLLDGGYKQR